MSYAALLESQLRTDAFQEAAGRVAALETQLLSLEKTSHAGGPPQDFDRELRYLERLVRSQGASPATMDLVKRVASLRSRCDAHFSSTSSAFSATMPPSTRERQQASGCEGDTCPSLRGLARFLRPGEPPRDAADEVQLLSAEGKLAGELSKFPFLAVPDTDRALILREWTDDDDAECKEREKLAILEIHQAAANLQEVHEYIANEVLMSQDAFNHIEQNVANASEQVQEGVAALQSAADKSDRRLLWLAPSLCAAVVGVGAVAAGPSVCIACVAKLALRRAGVLAVGMGASYLGQQRLLDWHQHAIEAARQQLPRTFHPLLPERVALLAAAGREAERRLRLKLAQRSSWKKHCLSLTGFKTGLVPRSRCSDISGDRYAYATSFDVDLPAFRAFQVLQWLTLSGSLDPGCKMVWSRPVDDNGTFLRYLLFSAWNIYRDFFCVVRCGSALEDLDLAPGDQMDDTAERYVFALASLDQHVLEALELPQPSSDIGHGTISVCGFVITSTGGGTSQVEVMADVDTSAPRCRLFNRELRLHVLHSADKLRNAMNQAG